MSLAHLFLKVNFLESEGLFIARAGSSILTALADDGLFSRDWGCGSPFPILEMAAAVRAAVGDLGCRMLVFKLLFKLEFRPYPILKGYFSILSKLLSVAYRLLIFCNGLSFEADGFWWTTDWLFRASTSMLSLLSFTEFCSYSSCPSPMNRLFVNSRKSKSSSLSKSYSTSMLLPLTSF